MAYEPTTHPYNYGVHPEDFMYDLEHRVGRPLESIALTVGADALTLLFTDTAPDRSLKVDKMRQAYGEFHATGAMEQVSIDYVQAKPDSFDAAAFNDYHQGGAYALIA